MTPDGKIHIGTSGFSYDRQWQPLIYPADADRKRLLSYYAQVFNAVEINNSFYRLPLASTVAGWHGQVPADFKICLKAPGTITHLKKLKDADADIAAFADIVQSLPASERGPVLLQLHPGLQADYNLLRQALEQFSARGCQVAVEARHASWYGDALNRVLDAAGAALVMHDMPRGKNPETNSGSDFVYMRFHGIGGRYHGAYAEDILSGVAARIADWRRGGKDVYVFFNNTARGDAIDDARRLRRMTDGP